VGSQEPWAGLGGAGAGTALHTCRALSRCPCLLKALHTRLAEDRASRVRPVLLVLNVYNTRGSPEAKRAGRPELETWPLAVQF
jgi:hypothetical protein